MEDEMQNLVLAAVAAACLVSTPAHACSLIPPGTPEQEAARTLDWQTRRMTDSDAIFVAQVVRVRRITVRGSPDRGRQVVLRALYSLKGALPRGTLQLQHLEYDSCGLYPSWDVMEGGRGETYVVFAKGADSRQDGILEAMRPDRLIQPELLSRLARVGEQP